MITVLKKHIPNNIKNWIRDFLKTLVSGNKHVKLYFSQSGEDIQIFNILKLNHDTGGVYVDVGAFHPTYLSNTHMLYRSGWRGINIDATPGSMKLFKKMRPDDINIEQAVSDKEEELVFFEYTSKAESSFDISYTLAAKDDNRIKQTKLKTKSLNQILSENSITTIDVLTIDAEGYDLKILKALNFEKYKPKLIVIEQVENSIEKIMASDLYRFVKEHNYVFVARTILGGNFGTSIFKHESIV